MTTRDRFWRPGSLAGEAFRRIAASPVRILVLVVASGIAFSATLALDHQAVSQTLQDHRNALNQGIGVVVIDKVPMDEHDSLRAACTLLDSHAGIQSAGGALSPDVRTLMIHPGIGARHVRFDSGAWRIWFPDVAVPISEIAVGEGLAARTGVAPGDPMRLDDEPSVTRRVSAVVGQKRSFVRSKEWLIETASTTEEIDQCWVEFPTGTTELEIDHVAAALSDISSYQIRPALANDPLRRDPIRDFEKRTVRWAPHAALVIIGLLYSTVVLGRRGERALYVTLGLRRTDEYLMTMVEVATVIVAPAILGTAIALHLGVNLNNPDDALAAKFVIENQILAIVGVLVLLPLLPALGRRSNLLEDLRA